MENRMDGRRPQQARPVAEHLYNLRTLHGTFVRDGEQDRRLPGRRPHIVEAKEMAVLAVRLVMVLRLEMAYALLASIVDVNSIVVYVHRRLHHQRQICRQQYPRCYEPHQFHF